MAIEHPTASTFLLLRRPGGWLAGMIRHPIFGRLMIPGGHVEPGETAPRAALRELSEETGILARLLPPPRPVVPPLLAAHRRVVSPPWWIVEQPIERDNHVREPHVHIDHIYVAMAEDAEPRATPAHPFAWHPLDALAGLDVFPDTAALADALLTELQGLERAGGAPA